MIIISPCNWCSHKREKKGFQMTCEAFPDGFPYDFDDDNVEHISECNNGIKFEVDEEKYKIFFPHKL